MNIVVNTLHLGCIRSAAEGVSQTRQTCLFLALKVPIGSVWILPAHTVFIYLIDPRLWMTLDYVASCPRYCVCYMNVNEQFLLTFQLVICL